MSIFNQYINLVRQEFKSAMQKREESIRWQFEEIQKLNNELINTRRQLTKTNQQLNFINQELEERLVRDNLTGLIGRYQYWSQMQRVITDFPHKFGLFFFLDLDNFKLINDNYGHGVGDRFLIEFAERLNKIPIDNSLKIRISGDEFALFIYGLNSVDDQYITDTWELIDSHLSAEPIQFDALSLPVAYSAGVAVYNQDTDQINELIEYADYAMYRAKRRGKNQLYQFDRQEYENESLRNQTQALDYLINNRKLCPVFEPVMKPEDEMIFGYMVDFACEDSYFEDFGQVKRTARQLGRFQSLQRLVAELCSLKQFPNIDDSITLFIPQMGQDICDVCGMESAVLVIDSENEISGQNSDLTETAVRLSLTGAHDLGNNDLLLLAGCPEFVIIPKEFADDIGRDDEKRKILLRIIDYSDTQDTQVIVQGIQSTRQYEVMKSLGADLLCGSIVEKIMESNKS